MEKKVCFILDSDNQGWGVRWTSVQRPTPPAPNNKGVRAFIYRGRGLHAETAQSALTALKLVIGGLTSIILIVLSTVNLQFHGQFVPISLKPILGLVAANVMAANFFHVVEVSVPIRQLTGYGSEYYL